MRRFLSPAWLLKHAAMILLVAAFLGLGWWQISRAASGNTLSYAYAVEWPLFAAFVIFVWYREIRAELRPADHGVDPGVVEAPPAGRAPVVVPVRRESIVDDDPALSAYNDYLAWLAADPGRRPGDYPGRAQGE